MLSIYKASAGSGKTHTLTREYLLMLFHDYHVQRDHFMPHGHILAVTFTKKATAEMKERILQALYVLSSSPTQSPFRKDLIAHLQTNISTIQSYAKHLLIGILQDYNRFFVSTIDGFFQQVIRTFALELGLSTTYELAMDGKEVMQQAVDDIFRSLRNYQDAKNADVASWITEFSLSNLENDAYWNPHGSISQFSRNLLQEKLIRHMAEVNEFFADKKRIAAYQLELKQITHTTTQHVARTIQQISSLIDGIDGLSSKVLGNFRKDPKTLIAKGLSNTFYQVLDNPNYLYTKSKTNKNQQRDILDLYYSKLQPLFIELAEIFEKEIVIYNTAQAILRNIYTIGLLQDVAKQVEATNKKIGRLPMSAINMLIHDVIDGQDAPFIYERMGQYLHHFMIDEFQDTSALQWQNFHPLITEAESKSYNNLIVGDIKQSIYRWRNSDWRLLNEINKEFHSVREPKMEYNWRSAPLLIERNEWIMQGYSQWVKDLIHSNQWEDNPLAQAIEQIYSYDAMHQKAKKEIPGVFHLEFFDQKIGNTTEQCLEALDKLLQQLVEEQIDLSRVAILTRKGFQAAMAANFLISRGYKVQSADGMRIHSHASVQLLVAILQKYTKDDNDIVNSIIHSTADQLNILLTPEIEDTIKQTFDLPLYEQIQMLINFLHLYQIDGASPYLTAFQDKVYQFSQDRVADLGAFLEYWEQKKDSFSIPSTSTNNTIRIMTIHNSKGLEFDIVVLPFLNWELQKWHREEILWCCPSKEPFNQMPLVAISPSQTILKTHFRDDYITEAISQYIDNLNLTYVAITRPKYRLYGFGPMYTLNKDHQPKIQCIGHLLSYICDQEYQNADKDSSITQLINNNDGSYTYHIEDDNTTIPTANDEKIATREAAFVSSPIGNRLKLRSRSEDDFAEEASLETIDLGILMHEWLATIITWEDAKPALERMLYEGRITTSQQDVMQQQLQDLKSLLQRERKEQWFIHPGKVLNEHDILTTTGKVLRPDRVMIDGRKATVIDYKFGHEHHNIYQEQLRNYVLLLEQMGYQVEAYIVYVAQYKIEQI